MIIYVTAESNIFTTSFIFLRAHNNLQAYVWTRSESFLIWIVELLRYNIVNYNNL